jgi:hypothetical protein
MQNTCGFEFGQRRNSPRRGTPLVPDPVKLDDCSFLGRRIHIVG